MAGGGRGHFAWGLRGLYLGLAWYFDALHLALRFHGALLLVCRALIGHVPLTRLSIREQLYMSDNPKLGYAVSSLHAAIKCLVLTFKYFFTAYAVL